MRIIESAIAVMLILAFVIFIQWKSPTLDASESAYRIQHQILSEIEKNESLRASVIRGDATMAAAYAKSRIQAYNLNVEMDICNIHESCICKNCPSGKSIYGDNIIIGSSLPEYNPKKLALFPW